ncbi:MAG: BON domain-containing protein [Burkholderiales bacterium]|nr:BON domain-containing protein [Burkholderiales bacterium]
MNAHNTRLALSIVLTSALFLFITGCKPQQETGTPPAPSTTVGTKIDDSVVTTRVKSALLADPSIKSFDIAAVTRKGEVQLSGFVDNQTQIDRAIDIVRGVEGVQSVTNKMSVKQ